jgi:hypothetical protein
VRKLNLHEAQSANIMRDHGVNTPKGGVAKTPEEAYKVLYVCVCVCGVCVCVHTHITSPRLLRRPIRSCVCVCLCVCVMFVCLYTHILRRQDS